MKKEKTGISAVLAVILLLALTLASASAVGVFLSSFYSAPSPDALFTSKVWIKENENVVWLELTHVGGKILNVQELKIKLEMWDNEGNPTVLDSRTPDGYTVTMNVRKGGTVLSAGEVLDVEFKLDQEPRGVDSSVYVIHVPSGRTAFWIPKSMVFPYAPTGPTPPPPPPSQPFAASFSFSPYLLATLDDNVRFWDESIGSIIGREWRFGDGGTSFAQNPAHRYTENGTYAVTLEITVDNGDKDNFSRIVQVVPPSRVKIRDGKLFVDNEHFTVKGVSYSPTPIGSSAGVGYLWWNDSETYLNDFPMLRGMGANTVRTYNSGTVEFPLQENAYPIYADWGIPPNTVIWAWGPATFDGDYIGENPPEGMKCFRTSTGSWGGWGDFNDVMAPPLNPYTVDLSGYDNLVFWVKTPANLKVEIQLDYNLGPKYTTFINQHGWDGNNTWQKIIIPASFFTGIGADLTRVYCPFMITLDSGGGTFYVDFVRWVAPIVGQLESPAIRVYATKETLDYAYLNNLKVIMGFWVSPNEDFENVAVRNLLINGFVEMVKKFKAHPAVLMWSFGSEVDHWMSGDVKSWYTLLQEAAQAAKAVDNNHPIMTVNQEIQEVGHIELKSDDASLSALDIWGVDAYRGPSFGDLFFEQGPRTKKPFLLAEWGADAWDYGRSIEDEATQENIIGNQWLGIIANSSTVAQARADVGGTVFEWCDEWWKAGAYEKHDTMYQWTCYGYPDPYMNEEWWGITEVSLGTYEKTPRLSYYKLEDFWSSGVSGVTTWEGVGYMIAPRARPLHAMAYDSSSGKVVLYGGFSGAYYDFRDTWLYDLSENRWTKMRPSTNPGSRRDHAMASLGNGKVLLFGNNGSGNDETWVYDISKDNWINMNPATKPPGRCWATMAQLSENKVVMIGGSSDPTSTWVYDYSANIWTNMNPAAGPSTNMTWGPSMASLGNNKAVLFGEGGWLDNTWVYNYATNTWTYMNPSTKPPGRWWGKMAYLADGKVVLFGGDSDELNDTWVYDYATNTWENKKPATAPSGRESHAMAYGGNNKAVLFGGEAWPNRFSDTWAYDLATNTWTKKSGGWDSYPTARYGHKMDYDSSGGKVVLFGGNNLISQVNDTWTYDPITKTWAKKSPATSPSAREQHAMVYDSLNNRTILYGGWGFYDDTWAYNLAADSWTRMNPLENINRRSYHAMAPLSNDKTVLFGGYLYGGSGYPNLYFGDTWVYNYTTNTWDNRKPATAPSARYGHAMASFDNNKAMLFGGYCSWPEYYKNDTWVYNYTTNTWDNRKPATAPSARYGHAMAPLGNNKAVLFGGYVSSGYENDTWVYDYTTNTWDNRKPATAPSARYGHAMAPLGNNKVVLFGGRPTYGYEEYDTWVYDFNTNTWTKMNPATYPGSRSNFAMAPLSANKVLLYGGYRSWLGGLYDTWVYDYSTDSWTEMTFTTRPNARDSHAMAPLSTNKVVLFGGNYQDDTWVYDYSTNTWTEMKSPTRPPRRADHAMAYAGNGKIVLFGGNSWGADRLNDTWVYEYATNTWTKKYPSTAPSPRAKHAMASLGNGRVLVFGSWSYESDTWVYDINTNTWTNMNPPTAPGGRCSHSMVYLSTNKALLFGGYNYSFLDDTWVYDYSNNTWTRMYPPATPRCRRDYAMAYNSTSNEIILFSGLGWDEWKATSVLDDPWTDWNGAYTDTWVYKNVAVASDFRLSITPVFADLMPGENAWATLSVNNLQAYGKNVTLSCRYSPPGVNVTLSPASGIPPFTSTVKVQVGSGVAPGVFAIEIVGTSADRQENRSCTFFVTVCDPSLEPKAIYNDSGFPLGGDIWTWTGDAGAQFDDQYTGESPPEGSKCFMASAPDNWVGWGIPLIWPSDHTMNLSGYRELRFWAKTPVDLKVMIQQENRYSAKQVAWIGDYGWNGANTWQEIAIPVKAFSGINMSRIFIPFSITASTGATFYVDNVRWVTKEAVAGPVNNPPVAGFSYSPSSPTTENIVQFIDQSTDSDGTIVSWSWNFGDGTPISTEQYPTHQYTTANTYTVTLTVTDDDGAVDSETKLVTVSSGNNPPTASFSYSPGSPIVNENVYFTDTSTDSDGTIVAWSWNFGDGTPVSTLKNPIHKYSSAGTYIVTLTVTDDDGAKDNISSGITVTSVPVGTMFQNFETSNGTPGVYFYDKYAANPSFEGLIVKEGVRSVKMNSSATWGTIGINAASPTGYINMENATTLSVWVYDTQGNNNIELRLKDNNGTLGLGLWSTMSSTQNVWTKITWDISSYSGVNKSRIVSIELCEYWNAVYYFDNVRFVATGGVNQPPTANFTYSPSAPDVGTIIQFTDQSTDSDGTIVSWSWNFGDGTPVSTLQNPTHQYSSAKTYTVTLTVKDDDGATNSISKNVGVGAYVVYNDSGIPSGTEVWTWDSYREWGVGPGPATFNGDYTGESPPEGSKCFLTSYAGGVTYAGWGVFLSGGQHENLRGYDYLKFWVKSTESYPNQDITVGMHSTMSSTGFSIKEFGWDPVDNANQWVPITIPRTRFSTIDFYMVTCPFKVTIKSTGGMPATFYIDNVRWVK